jgi:tetratricopeptide (TPR) repeat protein
MTWIIIAIVLALLFLMMFFRRQALVSRRVEGSHAPEGPEDDASIIARCSRILAAEPNNLGALVELGRAYHASGKQDKAMETFETVLALEPDHSEGLTGMGLVFRSLGRGEEARAQFTKALVTNRNNAMAHYGLGLIQYEADEYDDALESIKAALKIDRNVVPEDEAHEILESLEYIEDTKREKEQTQERD